MNKKFISIMFIFVLFFSFQANAFFFFGYGLSENNVKVNDESKNVALGNNENKFTNTNLVNNEDKFTNTNLINNNDKFTNVNLINNEDKFTNTNLINNNELFTNSQLGNKEDSFTNINLNDNENLFTNTNLNNDFDKNSNSNLFDGFDNFNNLFDNPNINDVPIPVFPPIINFPAEWNALNDIVVWQGSVDNTMVYPDLKCQCTDPDDDESFKIVSKHKNYDLFFVNDNLVLKNLDSSYLGEEKVIIDCNGIKEDFTLSVEKFPNSGYNYPAYWLSLNNIMIDQSTPDDTIIYHDLANRCVDDENKVIDVYWSSLNFDLYFSGNNLLIRNLNGFDSSRTYEFPIQVSCNGAFSVFDLTINPIDGADDDSKYVDYETDLMVSSIFIPNADKVKAGESLEVTLVLKNSGKDDLENIKVSAIIAELGTRSAAGPFDLKDGKKISKTLFIDIPEDTAKGTYYLRLDIGERVKYREILVL